LAKHPTAKRTEASMMPRHRAKAEDASPSEEADRGFGDAAMPGMLSGWSRDAGVRRRGVGRMSIRPAEQGALLRTDTPGGDAFAEGASRAVPRHGGTPAETWRLGALAEGGPQ